MAERRENSVLFSLKELRSIEEDRVKQELEEEQGRVDAARRAQEDEVRRAREDEERKLRDETDRLARLEQEKERQIREEKLRLETAERQARIDAQAKLEAARIQAEIHAKAHAKKAPVGIIVGIVVGVVALTGGGAWYVIHSKDVQHQAEMRQQAEEAQRQLEAAIAKMTAERDTEMKGLMAAAKTDLEREKIRADMERKKQQDLENLRAKAHHSSGGTAVAAPKPVEKFKLKCDPDKDPLCGTGM